jgi:hypothetical protein
MLGQWLWRATMLTIRKEQITVFEQAALRNFEDQMLEHLKGFTPRHYAILGEPGVRQVIRLGIERAGQYGLTSRGPVRFYIELIFMVGSDFDTDPQLPWAAEILNDSAIVNQMGRADRLYEAAMEYLSIVAGPQNTYVMEAMRQARQERLEDLPTSGEALDHAVLTRLNAIHPQKYAYVGEPGLRTLIQRGIESANSYAVDTGPGAALFIGLMFALGHGFATDPQFPWIANTLSNTAIVDTTKRVERLYSKMMTYLDHVLAYLAQG